ncbi:hypothetical protein ACFVTJ_17900 [Agrobacterium sp. NPDC058088]|uniref:hypothetical protein n=1 Tax=Agrobacterium sp. NPDC058088 TaxID=3346335 RepID=UPI0036DE974C
MTTRHLLILFLASVFISGAGAIDAAEQARKDDHIIVFMRHGEKPSNGLGQLSCRGLNRSLALPAVLTRLFGKPDRIIAPDPSRLKQDGGESYAYVRPLATIEPTAIANGLPVETSIGYDDVKELVSTLDPTDHPDHVTFVAWEHKKLVKAARALMEAEGGDRDEIPKWSGDDFDSLYVLNFPGNGGKPQFKHITQGLSALAETCP